MKVFRTLFILTVAIFGLSVFSVSAQTHVIGKNPKQGGIEQQVYREILMLPYYGLFDSISFKVDGNAVYLSGKVLNAINKSDAENVIKRISGVTDVINNIEILPMFSSDNQIRRSIIQEFDRRGASLFRYVQGVNPSMRIIVDGGRVSLEGYVSTKSDADLAKVLTNSVFGVFSVSDNLIIQKGS